MVQPEPERRGTWLTKWFQAGMVAWLLVSDIFFIEALYYIRGSGQLIVSALMVVLLGALLGLLPARPGSRFGGDRMCGAAGHCTRYERVPGSNWSCRGGGLAWAMFCVFRLWQGPDAPNALASGFALSAAISLLLHLGTETTVTPSPMAILSAVLVGAVPLALGNLAWDHGIRRGNRVLLAVLAYATPLVGALILIAFGFADATAGLLFGGVLIVAGGIISSR